MKITEIITGSKPSLSFEVFPPKTDDKFESVWSAAKEIAMLSPSYMSVTYGAGGGTSKFTAQIAEDIAGCGVTPLAHLSCISSDKEGVKQQLDMLREKGIENVLALRGDIPNDGSVLPTDYRYASELTRDIVEYGGFCVGGACYPETHPESENSAKDIEYLRIKVEAGCSFLTTQMFFDNDILYNFMYRLLRAGVNVPVVAGIMPVTNAAQIRRICSISGNALPQRFLRIVDRYADKPAALRQAGIAYAIEQVVDLYANGINAVHVYSMNHPDVARAIMDGVSEIIR